MKIGILTFHWATNYGAVLQAYALQTYLESIGHEVIILDYKPRHFDYTILNYLKNKKFLNHRKYLNSVKKEKALQIFREKYLNRSSRCYNSSDLSALIEEFNVLISGSDQVLNPSFLFNGDGRRKISTAYFLDFPFNGKKIGYAVSFGCEKYPECGKTIVSNCINKIDKIGVRESSGIDILQSLNYRNESQLVPDPTILCYKSLFCNINIRKPKTSNYLCAYILHKQMEIKAENVLYIDEINNPLPMEEWIGTIAYSNGLITNSYHGMIMALLNNVPFVAITVSSGSIGMNDRFSTLLKQLDLEDRLCSEQDDYMSVLSKKFDWLVINRRIESYSEIGKRFLSMIE